MDGDGLDCRRLAIEPMELVDVEARAAVQGPAARTRASGRVTTRGHVVQDGAPDRSARVTGTRRLEASRLARDRHRGRLTHRTAQRAGHCGPQGAW
jgi:hypothetical protein